MIAWPDNQDIAVVLALGAIVACYGSYWFAAVSPWIPVAWGRRLEPSRARLALVLTQRALGILLLGVVPLAVAMSLSRSDLRSMGLGAGTAVPLALWTGAMSAVAAPFSLLASRHQRFNDAFPRITADGSFLLASANVTTWLVYLLAYEFLFRGLVLLICVRSLGVYTAVALNVTLYFAVHLPYGLRVSFGTLPVGLAMCLATVSTGTIWPALVVHLVITSPNRQYIASRSAGAP